MRNKFLIAILCIGLLTIYFACEKDDALVNEEQVVEKDEVQNTPTLNIMTYDAAGETFNRLKSKLQIDPYFQLQYMSNEQARIAVDTMGFEIYTDKIQEITLGDYTSYTMLMATPNTTDSKFITLPLKIKTVKLVCL